MSAIHIGGMTAFPKREGPAATPHGLEQSIALVFRIQWPRELYAWGVAGEDRYLAKAAVDKANNELDRSSRLSFARSFGISILVLPV